MPVERAFGILKARFRILLKRCDMRLQNVPKMVATCLVLHIMCIVHGDSFDDVWIREAQADLERARGEALIMDEDIQNGLQEGLDEVTTLSQIDPSAVAQRAQRADTYTVEPTQVGGSQRRDNLARVMYNERENRNVRIVFGEQDSADESDSYCRCVEQRVFVEQHYLFLLGSRAFRSSCNLLKISKVLHSAESLESITHESISRLCNEDRLDEALQFVELIDRQKIPIPRDIIYDLLQGCTRKKNLFAARQVQSLMVKGGFDSISVLADHLIRLFTLCGSLLEADQAFCKVSKPSVYTWNSVISAHAKLGRAEKALDLYEDMQLEGVNPDKVTFLCVLKACGTIRAIDHGRLAHFQVLTSDPEMLVGVGNMLVDMYAKCGRIEEGHKVFDGLLHCDVISWGALMTGYAQEGHDYSVLELFEQMYTHSVKPNKVVFLSALRACAGISAIKQGFLTHHLVLESEVVIDTAMASALVDMYAKCGCLVEACQVFDVLPDKDVKAWGAIMSGYSALGSCDLVEQCFKDMKTQGLKPDNAIFTSILASYSHAGLLHQGHKHFQSMTAEYGIKPSTEHYNCMVDLLGRAGHLKEAKVLLDSSPKRPNLVGWLSLLTSCRTYNNPSIGRLCFTKVMELEPTEARGYMLMSNIYADANMWDDVDKIQELRKKARAWRKPGRSSIEINNKAYEFFVGGKINPQTDHIYERLDVLHKFIKEEGYVPQLEVVLEPVIESEKKPV